MVNDKDMGYVATSEGYKCNPPSPLKAILTVLSVQTQHPRLLYRDGVIKIFLPSSTLKLFSNITTAFCSLRIF